MKKTLSITLGGRAYIVEEDAYGALERYVNKIRAQFKDDPNVDELVADMEAGMADVFEKQQGKRKEPVLTLTDVEAMIQVMGAPEEIAEEEPAMGSAAKEPNRDEARTGASLRPKRLYRNPDDVVIAGVCSGLAAYLGVDVVIVRIAFIIAAFLNGFGILAYIIFWIAMPEATTSTQKLEMRGKPVNLQEIEELVKEKATKVSEEGKKAWDRMQDAKSPARRFLELPVRFVGACARVILKIVSVVIKLISGIIGVALIVAGAIAMAATTVAAAVMLFSIQSPYIQSDLPLHELVGDPRYYIGIAAVYFAVIIPLAFLIQIGGTFVTRRNQFQTTGIIVLTVIWFAAISTAGAIGAHLAPWAQTRLAENEAVQTITQEVAISDDVNALLLSGDTRLHVTRGDVASLIFTGREEDLAMVTTTVENGQLRLDTSRQEDRGRICLFCHRAGVRAELVLPELTAIETRNQAHVSLEGFGGDLLFTAEDYTHIDAEVEEAMNITTDQKDYSRIILEGATQSLTSRLEDYARMDAHDLHAASATVRTIDYARAVVRVTGLLDADAQDYSRITSLGEPKDTTIHESGFGKVTNEMGAY
ncbi:MAG: hypothetical protein RL141_259 [Candidatus Parcubacteria bacterium]|jgi:phage shock protein PspC (stress-responsive transcriptional regulator)